jgi:uncharacterized protein YigE (DUF2233 family)
VVASGLSYKNFVLGGPEDDTVLHAFKIDPRKLTLRPLYGKKKASVQRMREVAEALAVVNANFFDINDKPLGLVVADGRELNPKKNISWWSIFCIKEDKATILHGSHYQEGSCTQAVQAGPRLVVAGTIPNLKSETSRKTAVGVNIRGEVILTVSEGLVPIKTLAELYQRPATQGGLGCPNALNLDGGGSSQIDVKTDSFSLNVPGLSLVRVGLGVFHK